ncbi:MAG: enoyl-CoA hydratase/isomerase family protein [Proteobacteria bacterium]|nr:enoyl-CoA hydratase/isomerase family protein [Pseudomonadota bacterium]MBU1451884.1 enoyl-CoA hydratase/isomerase family protein [Pseudomonadota bacterium]MBU2470139.1 enoyl-CoA hydratase/isomerase family protein [Pseudomonadota bacterium]MBU2515965.1 enoyl-CoA hydratase/isomerase family protein [Pseudomonadota bacterium]
MSLKIKKVGVIGAGVMGATIAAHMANVGLPTVLLDIVPPKMPDPLAKKGVSEDSPLFRDYFAQNGLQGALKSRPASFYVPENAALITTGNLEDDFGLLAECDWIIEVVVELLDIKKDLLARIDKVRAPGAVVTTNTSGISVAAMSEHLSPEFQEHFLGTHFFNPPRYMKLFEIIPGPKTKPEVIDGMAQFAEKVLGKGVVFAKDTPNFIANRIGVFGMCYLNQLIDEMGLTIEEADALTGTVLGRPKMASYRLADLVGLDTLGHVAANVFDGCPDDENRETFQPTAWFKQMIANGWLGNKTKGGFYKKSKTPEGKKVMLVLDREKMEYRPKQKFKFASLEAAQQAPGAKGKLKAMYYAKDKAGEFTFRHISAAIIYAANRIPEIADDIVNIDNAMKWGFNWKMGPFEAWDALGLVKSVEAMKAAGYAIPAWVEDMLAAGNESFYKKENGEQYYYDIPSKGYKLVEVSPEIILLPSLKDRNKTVMENKGASLIDLGDGVLCLEFHSKMNSLGQDIISMCEKAADKVEDEGWEGLVVANHGTNFSVGANLMLVLFTAQEEEWDELDWMIKKFQDTFMRLKYMSKPVVTAPHQMALGGGCEICLASDRVVAAAESYVGLVEVGVGVIPAGGGTKELLLRNTHERVFKIERGGLYPKQVYLLPFVARAFETIAMAKVATSAPEAIKMGIFRPSDKVVVNADYRIKKAKDNVLAMNLAGYTAPRPIENIRVLGRDSMGIFNYALYNMHKAGFVTDHDINVATEVARVLTGGNVLPDTEVSEQYLLDLEREAFLKLCGMPQTQARMAHMLKTGKPLRN